MKMKAGLIALFIVILSFFFLKNHPVCGQTENRELPVAGKLVATEEVNTVDALTDIVQVIVELGKEIEDKKAKLHVAETHEERSEISKEIDKLNERLGALKVNFEEIATGLDLEFGRFQMPAPLHASNLMVVDKDTGKPTRVRRARNAEGKLVRVSKAGQILDAES